MAGEAYHKQKTSPTVEEGNREYSWWFAQLKKYPPYKDEEEKKKLKIIKNKTYLAMRKDLLTKASLVPKEEDEVIDVGKLNTLITNGRKVRSLMGWDSKKYSRFMKLHWAAVTVAQEFIMRNMRLVMKVISNKSRRKQYHPIIAELIPAGISGVMIALEKFDNNRDIKFSTYATLWIKQKVTRKMVKIFSSSVMRKSVIKRAYDDEVKMIKTLYDCTPSEQEVFTSLGWSEEQMLQFLRNDSSQFMVYIEDEISDKGLDIGGPYGNNSLIDKNLTVADNPLNALVWKETLDALEHSFDSMTSIERLVISLRFGYSKYNNSFVEDSIHKAVDYLVDKSIGKKAKDIKGNMGLKIRALNKICQGEGLKYNEVEVILEEPRDYIQQLERRGLKKMWFLLKSKGLDGT